MRVHAGWAGSHVCTVPYNGVVRLMQLIQISDLYPGLDKLCKLQSRRKQGPTFLLLILWPLVKASTLVRRADRQSELLLICLYQIYIRGMFSPISQVHDALVINIR